MQINLFQRLLSLVVCLFVYTLSAQDSIPFKLQQLSDNYETAGYHGSVLVAQGDTILTTTAFGISDQSTQKKMTPETLFKTESVGKMFTSVAVLQLAHSGKLDLKATIETYWPDSGIPNANRITLHQLLTHQSGLTSPWEAPGFEFRNYTETEWWHLITSNSLAFDTPGERYYYSNSGYIILAELVEKLSGMSFYDYCKKNIFKPSHMYATYFELDSVQLQQQVAKSYNWVGTKTFYEYPDNHLKGGGSGGWISCVKDLYLFGNSLLNGTLLNQASLELMMTPHVEVPPGHYGYGLEIYKDIMAPGKTTYGHNGGGMGYNCDLFFEPQSKTIVVTMMNMFTNSRYVTGNFMAAAFGHAPQIPEIDKRMLFFDSINEKGFEDFDGNYDSYLEAAGMVHGPNPFFLISIAEGLNLLGKTDQLERYLNTLLKILPEHPLVYIRMGDLKSKQKNNTEARDYYTHAQELAQKNEPFWLGEINSKLQYLGQ